MANWKPSLVVLLLLLAACAPADSPEQRARQFIDELETLAEDRQYLELVERVAGDYLDTRGNDKLKVAGILRAFYLRNKSVFLLTRIDNITVHSEDRITVELHLTMARQPFTGEQAASFPITNMHEIVLELAANGDSFEIYQSEWRGSGNSVIF